MRKHHPVRACLITLAACLAGCGEGDGISSQDKTAAQAGSANRIALAPLDTLSPFEAARLAKQATFGPTPELIDRIVASGTVEKWLDQQMSLSTSTYADLAAKPVPSNYCAELSGEAYNICRRDNFSSVPVAMRFYANAISGDDQLRQRVAFALSQIIVASDLKVGRTSGLATFNQILLDNAFGNYRAILKAATVNPYMGYYLDLHGSTKSLPNENYARELMQLFSIGTVLLNADGTPQTDDKGATIEAFSTTDVREISRALTGWSVQRLVGYTSPQGDFSRPMGTDAAAFDTGAKSFLDRSVAAGASQEANVDAVIDAIFYHPNTAPFVAQRLIKQLTLANPSPAYVGRVAATFADNGAGVRGDMKAVVKAIYTDSEARVVSQTPGKVKEPVLLAASLARAIGFKTDGYAFTTRDAEMAQQPFRAPSVFGFTSDSYPLPPAEGLASPASKLLTAATVVARHNLIYDWTVNGDSRSEYQRQPTIENSTGSQAKWASWEANGADDGKTIDRINLVLLNGEMTSAQRQALFVAMGAIKLSDGAAQARKRAQVALYIAATSSLFQVDR